MRIEIYSAPDGWRWRLRAANGKITADGAEGYASSGKVRRAVKRLFDVLCTGPLKILVVSA